MTWKRQIRHSRPLTGFEQLGERTLMATLPVLMVIADQRDFYYQEYGDTRQSLETGGLSVRVAATTTRASTPHENSGQGASSGVITPDLALAAVNSADYSAIVFVGGWGSSMYQFAYPGSYPNTLYNGNAATKATVNRLIGEFVEQDKFVTAICHGVTVLAWARVNGTSPLSGRTVATPDIGSPATTYNGRSYAPTELKQGEQVVANGATTFPSGRIGDPRTQADDVWVDGKIITGENYNSAREFGRVIAQQLQTIPPPPANHAPTDIQLVRITVKENVSGHVVGTLSATDPDPLDTHAFTVSDSRFEVVGDQLRLKAGAFLRVSDGPVQVQVTAVDSADEPLSFSKNFTLAVEANATPWRNATKAADVDLNNQADINDALHLLSQLRRQTAAWELPAFAYGSNAPCIDVDGNNRFDINDVLGVITHLRQERPQSAERESQPTNAANNSTSAVDAIFASLAMEDERRRR